MVWSNWQGATWRGAAAALLFWSGLAWTQSPTAPAERIMVVHENGKSTRCRVLESWQLPDGRVAHLLEALDTANRITIVDDSPPPGDHVTNPRAMPKRIFAWGQRRTPPEGSPIPPHYRQDSGVVVKNDVPTPAEAVQKPAPTIVQNIDEKVIDLPGSGIMKRRPEIRQGPGLLQRLFSKREVALMKPVDPQVVDFRNGPSGPLVMNEPPKILMPPAEPKVETVPIPVANLPAEPIQTGPQVMPTTPQTTIIEPILPPPVVVKHPETIYPEKKTWRPGANIQAWIGGRSTPKTETAKTPQSMADYLAAQNKVADKQLNERIEKIAKQPFSTATPVTPDVKKPEPSPLAIASKKDSVAHPALDVAKKEATEKHDLWGSTPAAPVLPPGRSLLDPPLVKPELVKLPPPPQAKLNDPLSTPERLIDDRSKPKGLTLPPANFDRPAPTAQQGWPVGTQSVQAATSGLSGPIMYVPVPTVTVPQPHNPPTPPAPKLPEAPQLNAYVNAFSPPPVPKGQQVLPTQPTMQQQQYMAQQQMLAQQMMMQQGYRPNPNMPQPGMMNPMMGRNAMPSSGPMANVSRNYAGPTPPNPFGAAPMQAMMPAPQQQPMLQPVAHQQMPTQQQGTAQQVDQLIKVMRESPYPAQREWAAQTLTGYDWRSLPQIVPALLQSASQDPAASVRAGCVYCLGRMGAAIEPVFGTLQQMRNDVDPRVRQEVEQAFTRLGQTPIAPR